MIKRNVLNRQKQEQLIDIYLESIRQYKVSGVAQNNRLTLNIGQDTFILDTTKNQEINTREVLSR